MIFFRFFIYCYPNAKQKGDFSTKKQHENKSDNDLSPTWFSKCEKIIMKTKFSMKDNKKVLEEIKQYSKEFDLK